jgi:hypothetical protein
MATVGQSLRTDIDHALTWAPGEPCELTRAGPLWHGHVATDARPRHRVHRRKQGCGLPETPYPQGAGSSGGTGNLGVEKAARTERYPTCFWKSPGMAGPLYPKVVAGLGATPLGLPPALATPCQRPLIPFGCPCRRYSRTVRGDIANRSATASGARWAPRRTPSLPWLRP